MLGIAVRVFALARLNIPSVPSRSQGRQPWVQTPLPTPAGAKQVGLAGRDPSRMPPGAVRGGSIWRVSESFPELAQAVTEHAQPSRIDIVRAKQHLLGQLSSGLPHSAERLIASVAALLGAEPLGRPQIDLPTRDSVKTVVTADHPFAAALRADITAREALAELTADGLLIPAGSRPLPASDEMTLGYSLPGSAAGQRLRVYRPGVLSDVLQLPHRLRQQGLWGMEPDIFVADLAGLGLDPRTERSLREAIESYRRGVFLAASSLLGAAVEGSWYAAGQLLRSAAPRVDELVDGDRTAQLQGAVAAALRDSLPGNRKWEADTLSQFARLMRDIRNYGVHPRQVTDGDIEVYFAEDKCGLLFLEAHRHLKHLAEITVQVAPSG